MADEADEALRREVERLRAEVERLRHEVDRLRSESGATRTRGLIGGVIRRARRLRPY